MQQLPRALQLREELVAAAGTLARAFDQTGHVRDDELALVRVDGSEHWLNRRERIGGDLRPRVRDPGEQGRLAGVREPDQSSVREQLQAQLVDALLAGEPGLGKPRRLPGRG